MELRHLRYFVVLADELHFGRAAKRLHISQPPLSFNIKQLEGTLGLKLLERSSHGVKLTPAGEAFRRSSLLLLAEADQAVRKARDVASGVTTRVRIGFVGSMLFRGLAREARAVPGGASPGADRTRRTEFGRATRGLRTRPDRPWLRAHPQGSFRSDQGPVHVGAVCPLHAEDGGKADKGSRSAAARTQAAGAVLARSLA